MKLFSRSALPMVVAAAFLGAPCFLRAQQLPLEPHHDSGQSVTGVFEGWFKNPDGTFSLLLGYYNRNLKEALEIPTGPNNRIEPSGPDRGQPTHFRAGRMWGSFTVTVPNDFGTKQLSWTIIANGKPTVIPASLKTDWEISPFVDATGNTPPVISFGSFEKNAPIVQGPRPLIASIETAGDPVVGFPVTLPVWVADDAMTSPGSRPMKTPVSVTWTMFRGPGAATFSEARPAIEKLEGKLPLKTAFAGKAITTVTFSAAGEYILQVTANDGTGDGGGGFQCCWTNAQLKISVKPESTGGQP